jgi:tripartite ATP-independent transporter DctP family solute receptor
LRGDAVLTRRRLLGGMLAGAAGAGCSRPDGAPQPLRLVGSDVHVAGYPTVRAQQWLGEELARRTDGRLNLRLFHSGQLGRESDAVELVRGGVIDMTRVHISVMANAVPATRALALPYLIDSTAQLRRAVDGKPGRSVLDSLQARGLVGLAIYDSGGRCIYNTRHPVTAPEELHGLKLRVPPSDLFIDMIRAFGANPTPLAYSETYSSLQTRLIDGAENNWSSFRSSRHYEVARYWSDTRHSYAPDLLMTSASTLASLRPQDQELLRELARQSVARMRALWDQQEDTARREALAAGVKEVAVDRDAFRRSVEPLVTAQLQNADIARLHAQIRELA